MTSENRPLCPHCLRGGCPWLLHHENNVRRGGYGPPIPPDACLGRYGHRITAAALTQATQDDVNGNDVTAMDTLLFPTPPDTPAQ